MERTRDAGGSGGSPLENAYALLSGDDDSERACQAIPDSACTALPRNYLLNVANGACSKLAEQLAGAKLVLPWIMGALGTPAALVGLLMPIRQTGSLLPQMAVAGRIRRLAVRKWVWTAAGAVQALCLLLMVLAALSLGGTGAGLAILALLAIFSLASGASSVAFQDVMGKTIPQGRRGRLLANRAAIGGGLTIAAGLLINRWVDAESPLLTYLLLLLIGAGLFAAAAALFGVIREQAGATEGGRDLLEELHASLGLARAAAGFRRHLLARSLLVTVEIATPFYVLFAQANVANGAALLGMLVITVGLAEVVSSPFWGRFADTSSRRVMAYSGLMGTAAAGLALLVGWLAWDSPYLFAPVFLLLGVAEAGVRLGRKTYLVDAVPARDRPSYVAFSNSLTGVVTLLAGALGLVAQFGSLDMVLGTLAILALLGALASLRMPEAEAMLTGKCNG